MKFEDDANCDATRERIRNGEYSGTTAGLCPGFIQANVVILPTDQAEAFAEYCYLNPKPCPLIAMGDRGACSLEDLGNQIDIRTDVAGYSVFRFSEWFSDELSITHLWEEDFVAFAIGCSFSFERALAEQKIPLKHVEASSTVPMFKTEIMTVPVEPFSGELVVSMRPIPKDRLQDVRSICSQYPHSHGEPVHWGDPAALGITDLSKPDWGDPLEINNDEVPVFWACGVTTQEAIRHSKVPIAITHRPGAMLITQLSENSKISVPGLT